MRRAGALAIAAASVAIAACGYGFAVGGATLPEGVERVWVPVFANGSTDAEAGALFAEALAAALARAGRDGGPGASARAEGRVVRVEARPAATGPDGRDVGMYRVAAEVEIRLVREGRTLCVRRFAGEEDFLPTVDLLGIEASRRQALRRLADRLMARAADSLCPVVVAE